MEIVNLEINDDPKYADIYSIKINGVEIADKITEIKFKLTASGLPELTVKTTIDHISSNTRAVFDIPEPYKTFIDAANQRR